MLERLVLAIHAIVTPYHYALTKLNRERCQRYV